MKYLSAEDILQIHHALIEETGGSHDVRDLGALEALVALPAQRAFGKKLYPTVFLKAAVYLRNIAMVHPFVDGNKRTSITAAVIFLAENKYAFEAKEGEIEQFVLRVVNEKTELEGIAAWLKKHTKKRKT